MGETSSMSQVGAREKQLSFFLILSHLHNEGARVAATFQGKLLQTYVEDEVG